MTLIIFIIVFVIFIIIVTMNAYSNGGKLKVIIYDDEKSLILLTLKYENFEDTFQVIGNSTVWNHYPSGKRCGTLMEGDIVEAVIAYLILKDKL